MPRWIYIAPPDSCAKSEQAVAAFFSTLGPEFTIRWGFPYKDNGSVWREGDFIIQGPDGHILVVEAKAAPAPLGHRLHATSGNAAIRHGDSSLSIPAFHRSKK